jgi:histidinol-phosphate/aromatic aminotransferase/cobyric acid decarboxylase-like protein
MANGFRRAASELQGVERYIVLAGNGSDPLLTILIRSFIEPEASGAFSLA